MFARSSAKQHPSFNGCIGRLTELDEATWRWHMSLVSKDSVGLQLKWVKEDNMNEVEAVKED